MRLQRQLIEHDPDKGQYGDCMRTCIAVILDLDAEDVPHWLNGGDDQTTDWFRDMVNWLAKRGHSYARFAYNGDHSLEDVLGFCSTHNPDTPIIVMGTSSLGTNHVVVALNGEIACDPSGNGLVGPTIEGNWEIALICVAAS